MLGALVGVLILEALPEVDSWRIMLGFGVIPALVIVYLRRATPESPRWLARNGREEGAAAIAERLCGRPVRVTETDRATTEETP